ncbi:MAG: CARDB domain-containing protein [Dehalococcoidia bacterium]
MSERLGFDPPDEPVIGADYPPLATLESSEYDNGEDYDDFDDGYAEEGYAYGDEVEPYYEPAPAHNPLFYVLAVLGVLAGAAAIFVLFALVRGGDDDDSGLPAAVSPGQFKIELVSPKNGDRQKTGEPIEVVVRAEFSEPITRFELYVADRLVDQVQANVPAVGQAYNATLKTTFDRRGDYALFVKAVASSGQSKDTGRITLSAIEEPGDRPVKVTGRVLATVTLRTGAGENFAEAGTLQPGTAVSIIGRTRDNEWLLLDIETGRWVKRTGVQEDDSLALVPVRETVPTATPFTGPTASPTGSVTPSPSATANLADLTPVDAKFVLNGPGRVSLRISIRNEGAAYAGPLVIGVVTTPAGLVPAQLAFDVNIASGRTATVDFEATAQPGARIDVTVRVDPANAVRETSKDNNTTTFKGVAPPADPSDIVIASVQVQPGPSGTITVNVQNNGGALTTSEIRVKVTIGSADASIVKSQSFAANEVSSFTFQKFATGTGRVEVSINGVPTASANIEVAGGGAATPASSPAASATATPGQ